MLDIGIGLSLLFLAFYGTRIGLILAGIDVIGLIIGVFVAGKLYALLGGVMTFVPDEATAKIIAFAVIVVLIIIATEIASRKVKLRVKAPIAKWLDASLGGVFFLLWGAILLSTLLTVWIAMYPDVATTTNMKDSFLVAMLLNYIPVGTVLLPQEFGAASSYF